MFIDEEKLEREARQFAEVLAYYIKLGFKQLGKLFDLFSFNLHSSSADDTFEFGSYSVIGFSLILVGLYLVIVTTSLFPPVEIAFIFFTFTLIGLFLYLK